MNYGPDILSTVAASNAKRRRNAGKRHVGTGAIFKPGTMLSGKKLKKASRALTRIEIRPALKSYARQGQDLEAQRVGAEQGLIGLGERTAAGVGSAYDALAGSSAQTVSRQQALAQALNQNAQAVNSQANQNLTAAQSGELGGLTDALKSRNVEPGGSASQQALAQQAQAQQQAAADRAQGYGAFAQAQGASFQGLAGAQAQAEQMRGREAQAGIHQAIADRIAQSNSDYGQAIRETRGKRADAKALWGPTMLKNLLQLRGSEREFGNAQGALGVKSDYTKAIQNVARLGLKGKKASAGATRAQAGASKAPKKTTVVTKYPKKKK